MINFNYFLNYKSKTHLTKSSKIFSIIKRFTQGGGGPKKFGNQLRKNCIGVGCNNPKPFMPPKTNPTNNPANPRNNSANDTNNTPTNNPINTNNNQRAKFNDTLQNRGQELKNPSRDTSINNNNNTQTPPNKTFEDIKKELENPSLDANSLGGRKPDTWVSLDSKQLFLAELEEYSTSIFRVTPPIPTSTIIATPKPTATPLTPNTPIPTQTPRPTPTPLPTPSPTDYRIPPAPPLPTPTLLIAPPIDYRIPPAPPLPPSPEVKNISLETPTENPTKTPTETLTKQISDVYEILQILRDNGSLKLQDNEEKLTSRYHELANQIPENCEKTQLDVNVLESKQIFPFAFGILQVTNIFETLFLSGIHNHVLMVADLEDNKKLALGYITSFKGKGNYLTIKLSDTQPFNYDPKSNKIQYLTLLSKPFLIQKKEHFKELSDCQLADGRTINQHQVGLAYINNQEINDILQEQMKTTVIPELKKKDGYINIYDGKGVTIEQANQVATQAGIEREPRVKKLFKLYKTKKGSQEWLTNTEKVLDQLTFQDLKACIDAYEDSLKKTTI